MATKGNSPIRIRVLDDSYQLASFDCGDTSINGFLHDSALAQQANGYSKTYVLCVGSSQRPSAFVTLLTGSLQLKEPSAGPFSDFPYRDVPGILIGRLGTTLDSQNQGYASTLVKYSLGLADNVREKVGCRVVYLHSYRKQVSFYERLGFQVGSGSYFHLSGLQRYVLMWLDLLAG